MSICASMLVQSGVFYMADIIIDNIIKDFLIENKDKIIPCHKENKKDNDYKDTNFDYKIYNEFSLQHELGLYLLKKLGEEYEVFFEKNIKNFLTEKQLITFEEEYKKSTEDIHCESIIKEKREVDLIIIKKENDIITKKYAIELKFPINGQYPNQMKAFLCDMHFMKNLKIAWDNSNTYCLTLVNDHNFYQESGFEDRNKENKENYKNYVYFRNISNKSNLIAEDTNYFIKNIHIQWNFLKNCDAESKNKIQYYLIDL